jgi:hypothetical protein
MNPLTLKKLVLELKSPQPDKIPDGWISRQDMQKKLNISEQTANRYILNMFKNNPDKIETKKFKCININGTVCFKPYYKFSKIKTLKWFTEKKANKKN